VSLREEKKSAMMILDAVFMIALGLLVLIGWVLDAGSRAAQPSDPGGLPPSRPVR